MKKQIAVVTAALTLAAGLSGCTFSTPNSVGSIGDSDISSGLYLFMQYNAYKGAQGLTDETDVLNATLTLDDGTEQKGSDYVSAETLKSMEYYAAVNAKFAEMGGEFTEDDEASAKTQYDSVQTNLGDSLAENGVGEESVMTYMRNLVKATRLIDMTYGPEGTDPISDDDVWSYIDENFTLGDYVSFYLFNYTDYSALSDDAMATVRENAQKICDDVKAGSTIKDAAAKYMPAICEAMGMEYTDDTLDSICGSLYATPSTASNYGESIGPMLLNVRNGDCQVLEADSMMMIYCSVAIEDVYDLDSIRTTALVEMKGTEMDDQLHAEGAALPHNLSESAMKKLPASKIKD